VADPDIEPTLADVQREFSGWVCWKAVNGLFYARRSTRPYNSGFDVKGEDPFDLRNAIVRADAQTEQ
jgi:hypothetical protein